MLLDGGCAKSLVYKMGNAFLLIVVGLLLFYLVISDKWFCVEGFLGCVTGIKGANTQAGTGAPTDAPNRPPTFLPKGGAGSPWGLPTPSVQTLAPNPFPTNVNWGFYNGV